MRRVIPLIRRLLVAFLLPPVAIAAAQCRPPTGKTLARLPAGLTFMQAGKPVAVKTYDGRKLMIWQVATWCSSCAAGLRILARHRAEIDAADARVLILRAYKNGGYPGIGIKAFARKAAPALLRDPHFIFGDDTKPLFVRTNPLHEVDFYQLVAANGRVVATDSAPSASWSTIAAFLK